LLRNKRGEVENKRGEVENERGGKLLPTLKNYFDW